ncbi:DUF2892 domain-containing protein [Schleiferiaceae bacterium]|jgi:hypothetical protein|nr:DUF2892 domain-containing protein [Schleiferiaceae bacterium]MDA9151205.1 DUF2892 domain-containing protein [Schleiferiaceae bacterium]
MIRKYLRLAIAVLFMGTAIWQFTDREIGNGIFLVLLTGIPVLFHFRNERILLALWHVRKQDFVKAEKQLDAIAKPEQTLIKGQLAYYYFLRGLMTSQTNLSKSETWMKKALNTGLRLKQDRALAKMQLAAMAMTKRKKKEAQILLTEAKKLDDKGLLADQLKMLQAQMRRI